MSYTMEPLKPHVERGQRVIRAIQQQIRLLHSGPKENVVVMLRPARNGRTLEIYKALEDLLTTIQLHNVSSMVGEIVQKGCFMRRGERIFLTEEVKKTLQSMLKP